MSYFLKLFTQLKKALYGDAMLVDQRGPPIRLFHAPPSLNIRHWFLNQIEALRVRKHGGIRGERAT